jgi:K+-transporting ATPase c subunit
VRKNKIKDKACDSQVFVGSLCNLGSGLDYILSAENSELQILLAARSDSCGKIFVEQKCTLWVRKYETKPRCAHFGEVYVLSMYSSRWRYEIS